MIPAGLNHLALTVSDLQRSAEFHDRVLGHRGYVRGTVPDHVKRSMRTELLAWGCEAGSMNLRPAAPGHAGDKPVRESPGLNQFAFNARSRQDVDGLHRVLLEIQAEVLDPPADYGCLPEWYPVYFLDPDGIKLEYAFTAEKTALLRQ